MSSLIRLDTSCVYLDFVLAAGTASAAVISYYHRSLQEIKAFGANLNVSGADIIVCHDDGNKKVFLNPMNDQWVTFIQPMVKGKEKFFHAISMTTKLNDSMLLLKRGQESFMFYDFLMKKYDYPLMREWGGELFDWFELNGYISSENLFISENPATRSQSILVNGRNIALDDVYALNLCGINEVLLKTAIKELFNEGRIWISKERQQPLCFKDMDSYFKKYGPTLVANLEKLLNPLTNLDGEAHDFTLKNMRLYPQQLATVNGDVELLTEHSNYAILNHGMGTGKTIVAASIVESYFTRKWMKRHHGTILRDAYTGKNVCYRNIVMAPGHLVEKWAKEVREQIPGSKVEILRDFSQLVALRKRGSKRSGKEWYVISKDFGKLTYQLEPTPVKRRRGYIMGKVCKDCERQYFSPGHTCPNCGSRKYFLKPSGRRRTGMVCPHCNNILLENIYQNTGVEDVEKVLDHDSFTAQRDRNSHCFFCEEELWQPHVANLGPNERKQKWVRVTHFANAAHKRKKTVWLHEDYMDEYFMEIKESPLNVIKREGTRKYSPVEFIKRYLKGYFDFAVFDEAHLYKGGSTGQGHAMHALVRASKKQLALTGTIAGGYANHLYYLLWRLCPARMRKLGYEFSDEIRFIEKYGKLERTYEYGGVTDTDYNSSCKGRQKSQAKVKPGISPLIFMDFLLDSTTFLDLSDMSKYLPKLKETVVTVAPESVEERDMVRSYLNVIDDLVAVGHDSEMGGKGVLSTMLQFSLSYIDKPYGVNPILSPKNGAIIAKPRSYDSFLGTGNYDGLLAKEKKLVELVTSELAEGRNCFVFCEYTGSPETCITHRLKEVLEIHCNLKGKVAILESESPKASEREAWMHKKASEGIKVFITNPRCVETGLDFCFKYEGKVYNYPTIFFYQMGYSLFTIWQASRRHYRLNQTEECRTYYMALEGTVQTKVIELIAEKQAATSAIQGKFSTEGLAAMANGTDARMKLAQSLSSLDETSGNDLQEMFDVLAVHDEDNAVYEKYKVMSLYHEIIGEEKEERTFDEVKTKEMSGLFMYHLFDLSNYTPIEQTENAADMVVEEIRIPDTVEKTAGRSKRKFNDVAGQMSLFSI